MTKVRYSADKPPRLDLTALEPYDRQKEILNAEKRFRVVAFGRQSGKSWTVRYWLLDGAINKDMRCWWVFPTYGTAKAHWDELLRFFDRSKFPVKEINKSDMHIEFWGGGFITIKSAHDPDNLRGPTLDRIALDEAAFVAEKVWTAVLQPMLTASRGEALLVSTPNGRNYFWQVFQEGMNPDNDLYASWHMPSSESPYQDKQTLEGIRRSIPKMVWREEYLAEFLADGGGVFIGVDNVTKVLGLLEPPEGSKSQYVMGVDWGMDGDRTAISIFDISLRKQVYGEAFVDYGTTGTVERVLLLMDIWHPKVTVVEKNGVGQPLFKLLVEKVTGSSVDREWALDDEDEAVINGRYKIKGFDTSNTSKRNMVENLAVAVEWGRVELLAEHGHPNEKVNEFARRQISEMSTFERQRTKAGNVTYGASEGNHDDTVMASCLAYTEMPKAKRWRHDKKQGESRKNPFKKRGKLYASRKPVYPTN